jgi:YVTN family beta-propeller protein
MTVAYSPDGSTVYSVGSGSDDVTVINPSTQTFIAFPTSLAPYLVGATVDGAAIIAVNNAGTFQEYDAVTFNPIGSPVTSFTCNSAAGGSVSPDGNRYYLACRNEIDTISLANGNPTLLSAITNYQSGAPTSVAITPDSSRVYALSSTTGSVWDLSVSSGGLNAEREHCQHGRSSRGSGPAQPCHADRKQRHCNA